jgi:hypothetical protein
MISRRRSQIASRIRQPPIRRGLIERAGWRRNSHRDIKRIQRPIRPVVCGDDSTDRSTGGRLTAARDILQRKRMPGQRNRHLEIEITRISKTAHWPALDCRHGGSITRSRRPARSGRRAIGITRRTRVTRRLRPRTRLRQQEHGGHQAENAEDTAMGDFHGGVWLGILG